MKTTDIIGTIKPHDVLVNFEFSAKNDYIMLNP